MRIGSAVEHVVDGAAWPLAREAPIVAVHRARSDGNQPTQGVAREPLPEPKQVVLGGQRGAPWRVERTVLVETDQRGFVEGGGRLVDAATPAPRGDAGQEAPGGKSGGIAAMQAVRDQRLGDRLYRRHRSSEEADPGVMEARVREGHDEVPQSRMEGH